MREETDHEMRNRFIHIHQTGSYMHLAFHGEKIEILDLALDH